MSSTTAELGAIYLAIQHAPPASSVTVHTDSQCAIAKLRSWSPSTMTTRDMLRDPEHELLGAIHCALEAGTSPFRLNWIKGHSGILQNEEADRMAKEALMPGKAAPLRLRDLGQIQFKLGGGTAYPRTLLKEQAHKAHRVCHLLSSHGALLRQSGEHLAISAAALQQPLGQEASLSTSLGSSRARGFRL
jgi:hypothetical protein